MLKKQREEKKKKQTCCSWSESRTSWTWTSFQVRREQEVSEQSSEQMRVRFRMMSTSTDYNFEWHTNEAKTIGVSTNIKHGPHSHVRCAFTRGVRRHGERNRKSAYSTHEKAPTIRACDVARSHVLCTP